MNFSHRIPLRQSHFSTPIAACVGKGNKGNQDTPSARRIREACQPRIEKQRNSPYEPTRHASRSRQLDCVAPGGKLPGPQFEQTWCCYQPVHAKLSRIVPAFCSMHSPSTVSRVSCLKLLPFELTPPVHHCRLLLGDCVLSPASSVNRRITWETLVDRGSVATWAN
jgi:hypothetical protein